VNNLDPAWLQSFVAIADGGALARAAERVNRTPSAISVQLRQLESTLGSRLVERTTRSLRLTAEGERLLPFARRLLDLQQAAIDAVKPIHSDAVWRVGLSEYFMPARLNGLLALLQQEARGARLEVTWMRSAELQQQWSRKALELVVVTAHTPPPGAELLRRESLAWVAAPGFHPPQEGALPLVLLSEGCPVREMALASLAKRGRTPQIRLTCGGSQAAVTAIRAGWGVGCLNESAAPADLELLAQRNARAWPSPGRLNFYLLAQPELQGLARKIKDWAR
jgi:DNA-binding transcriptional LysR family regulator